MIRKSVQRSSEKIMANKNLGRWRKRRRRLPAEQDALV
jgi:hypothetical protein